MNKIYQSTKQIKFDNLLKLNLLSKKVLTMVFELFLMNKVEY